MNVWKRTLLRMLPPEYKLRIALRLVRSASAEGRALTDLFVPASSSYRFYPPDWNSGLGHSLHALFGLCRAMHPETVVEIGSARGQSTCALALACRQNGKGKVYAIDPHLSDIDWSEGEGEQTLEFLLARLSDYELSPSWCQVIRATSAAASRDWNKLIDLLFIDGDHSYEGVKQDFELFLPWLSEDSLVVFHDSMWLRHDLPNAALPQPKRQ